MHKRDSLRRQITTCIFLMLTSVPHIAISIQTLSTIASFGILNYLGIGLCISLLVLQLLRIMRPEEDVLTLNNLFLMLKFGLIGISISSSGFITTATLLLYEKLPYAKHDSYLKEWIHSAESKPPVLRFLHLYVLQPFAVFGLAYSFLLISALPLGLFIAYIQAYSQGIAAWAVSTMMLAIPIYAAAFIIFVCGSYMVGGNIKTLFRLPHNTAYIPSDYVPFSNIHRNFKWMLIAFLIASPTVWIPIFFPGFLTGLLSVTASLTQFQYAMYCIFSVIICSIEPIVDGIVFRILFYRYAVLENLCPVDHNEMSWNQKVSFAVLSGALYAFAHMPLLSQLWFAYFCMGMLSTMLTFLSGQIDYCVFTNIFHNLSITFLPSFCCLWYKAGYEFTKYITPITSNFLKYALVSNFEHDYCNNAVREVSPSPKGEGLVPLW